MLWQPANLSSPTVGTPHPLRRTHRSMWHNRCFSSISGIWCQATLGTYYTRQQCRAGRSVSRKENTIETFLDMETDVTQRFFIDQSRLPPCDPDHTIIHFPVLANSVLPMHARVYQIRCTLISLRSIIVVPHSQRSLAFAEAMGPSTLQVNVAARNVSGGSDQRYSHHLRLRHALVRQEQPETEDGLGQHIEHGVADDLGVNAHAARAITNAPDTVHHQFSDPRPNELRVTHMG